MSNLPKDEKNSESIWVTTDFVVENIEVRWSEIVDGSVELTRVVKRKRVVLEGALEERTDGKNLAHKRGAPTPKVSHI